MSICDGLFSTYCIELLWSYIEVIDFILKVDESKIAIWFGHTTMFNNHYLRKMLFNKQDGAKKISLFKSTIMLCETDNIRI
jgi:hypothetical protein